MSKSEIFAIILGSSFLSTVLNVVFSGWLENRRIRNEEEIYLYRELNLKLGLAKTIHKTILETSQDLIDLRKRIPTINIEAENNLQNQINSEMVSTGAPLVAAWWKVVDGINILLTAKAGYIRARDYLPVQNYFEAYTKRIVIGKDSAAKSHNLSDEKYKEYQDSIFTSLDKLQASINMPQGCFFKV